MPLLDCEPLTRPSPVAGERMVQALTDVSTAEVGKTLAIVGVSGCGKSILARCASTLAPPGAGRVLPRGKAEVVPS